MRTATAGIAHRIIALAPAGIALACALFSAACSGGSSSGPSANLQYTVGAGAGTAAPIPDQFSGSTGIAQANPVDNHPVGFSNPVPGGPLRLPKTINPTLRASAINPSLFRSPAFTIRAPHFHIH